MRVRCFFGPMAALGAAACGPNSFYPGLMVAPSVFRDSIRTVAVAPLRADSTEVPEAAAFRFEDVTEEELERLGFEVIPAAEYERLWAQVYDEAGVFDSLAGREDSSRLARARDTFTASLERDWAVDAIVHIAVWEVVARYTQGVADWDGTSQEVSGAAARIGAAIAASFAGQRSGPLAGGNIRAVSLGVVIESLAGERLYENAGGIQVRQRIAIDRGGWYDVSTDELFGDRGRNDVAVTLALRLLRAQLVPGN